MVDPLMKLYLNIALLFLLCLTGCSGDSNPAKKLKEVNTVYVLIELASIQSLNQELAPSLSNYGEVTSNDFKPQYKLCSFMENGSEGLAITAYTDEKLIPAGNMYMLMNVRQLFDVALGLYNGTPISVNHDSGYLEYNLTTKNIISILPEFPETPPLPLDVRKTI